MIDSGDIPQTITYDSILMVVSNFEVYNYSNSSGVNDNIWLMPLLIIPIVIAVYVLFFSAMGSWRRGIFPKKLPYNRENLFDAYIILGIQMMRQDLSDFKEQGGYLRSYLTNKFRSGQNHSNSHIMSLIRLDVSLESTLTWLQKKMPEAERIQVIDFLADLAFYDHQAHPREIAMINRVADILEVDRQQVTAILSIRFQRYEKQQSRKTPVRDDERIQASLRILGLEKLVSFEEIKRTYRKMVRRFHPDRFARMSKEEQEMAHERFTEINLAYEYLEGRFN